MVSAEYEKDPESIVIRDQWDNVRITLCEAEELIDRLRQILDEHPEE